MSHLDLGTVHSTFRVITNFAKHMEQNQRHGKRASIISWNLNLSRSCFTANFFHYHGTVTLFFPGGYSTDNYRFMNPGTRWRLYRATHHQVYIDTGDCNQYSFAPNYRLLTYSRTYSRHLKNGIAMSALSSTAVSETPDVPPGENYIAFPVY